MNFKTHHNWWQGLLCLLVSLSFGQTGHAQVNYLSVFGTTNNCLTGSPHNRLSCNSIPNMTPTSGKSDITDNWASLNGGVGRDNFKNSCYDKAGNLLFTVNENGVYAPDGTQRYTFAPDLDSFILVTPTGAPPVMLVPGRAISEIVIVPVPNVCNQYYAVFWCMDINAHEYELRAITISVDITTFPAASSINCRSNVVVDLNNPDANYLNGTIYSTNPFRMLVAADAVNMDGSRDIYTLQPADSGCSLMRKWTISSSGDLPTNAYTYYDHIPPGAGRYQTNAYGEKAKILKIGDTKYFTYITGRTGAELSGGGPRLGYYLNLYTLNNATSIYNTAFAASLLPAVWLPKLDWEHEQISGFDYVPSKNVIYFTYTYSSMAGTISDGGTGYFNDIGGVVRSSNSTADYKFSDIELTKKGDLLMVNGSAPDHTDGHLAYLNVSDVGFTPSAVITPTVITTSCSTLTHIPVMNKIKIGVEGAGHRAYYLGSQIRGEDYSSWGADISSVYTVTGTETWTPTANPVATPSGVSTSSISCRGIVIEPGGSLTIQGMTVNMTENSFIDVKASTSSAAGGRLFLDNATLTSNTGGCDNPTWSMWGGVRVLGVPTQPQGGVLSSKQGYVKMINNSEISYAHTAIQAGMLGTVTFYIFTMPITIPIPANGGGIVQAFNSTFRNNNNGVVFFPYSNTNPVTGATLNNISFFHSDKFLSDESRTIVNGSLKHINGMNVKGIRVLGTDFQNNTGVFTNSYGIYAQNMGITVDHVSTIAPYTSTPSKFRGFGTGIYHTSNGNSTTLTVRNSEFHNNYVGIHLSHTQGAVVANNLFNVPGVAAVSVISPSPFYTPTPFQTIGVFLQYANLFSVYNNTFQYASYVRVGRHGAANGTVGVLAYETGAQNNVINNNKYNGLSTANLANFGNRYGANGLWYKCNDMSNNGHDIAARGSDPGNPSDMNVGHGIRIYQGLPAGYTGYSAGQTAGNTFSKGSNFNIYNNTATECTPFTYYYSSPSFGGLPTNKPGEPGVTGLIFNTAMAGNVTMLNTANRCSLDMYNPDGMASLGGLLPISVSMNWRADEKYTAVVSNINYYMADSAGVEHRDSLYYWVNELQTPDAALMTANMLLEDSLIDSAYAVYDAIATTYPMSSKDSMAYAHSGKQLFMVQVAEAIKGGAPTTLFAALATHIDTLADSMYFEEQITDIVAAYEGTTGWARGRAQNMLLQYSKTLYDSMVQVMPDTLLFPVLPDSILAQPSPKGSLAVTEYSQGPVAGCQYAELTVTSCDANSSPYADVRGWMINDYSGALTECSPYNANPGHYRLAYDAMWANVNIGSVIVLYNHGNNCYNLPDSFSIDTFNSVYYIPVGSAGALHVEQYYPAEGSSPCSYCSDSGATVYSDSLTWDAISIDSVLDAIQVLCPGCTVDIPEAPRVYFGAGFYLQEGTSGAKGTDSIGYVVIRNTDSASGYKYVFTGINANQLLSPNMWTVSIADPAGSKPATLGNVNTEFFERILTHTALMPCCGATQGNEGGEGAGRPGKDENTKGAMQGAAGVKVYPNPASMLLYFEYTASPKATICITDVTGRLIDQQVVKDAGKAAIDVKGYAPGVYMYQITTDATTQTGKVVIGN